MVTPPPHPPTQRLTRRPSESDEVWKLRVEVQQYRDLLHRLQMEREFTIRRKRRQLLVAGLVISIAFHIILILYLSLTYRMPGHPGVTAATFDVAILHGEELIPIGEMEFDGSDLEEPTELIEVSVDDAALIEDATPASADLNALGGEEADTLGGSGDGLTGEGGLGGAGAGTSYFGIAGRGTRFAYIVDRSGSMAQHNRMERANRELARSIQALPDYAFFHVLFFSTGEPMHPPMQRGWIPAKRSSVTAFVRWLGDVAASGGTMPRSAFEAVFALDIRPDVIFFMTDGIIEEQNLVASEVRSMNGRGSRRVVIHTIAFGDAGSEELLRTIARDSGGVYRYIPDGGP